MVNELEAVKSKIAELEAKKKELERQVVEITQAIENSIEDLLIGRVSEEDVENVKELLNDKQKELSKTTELLERAYAIKKKLAVEKFVPFAKERRKKKIADIQERYDEQVEVVRKAIRNLLHEQAKLGQIKAEIGEANAEYNETLSKLGLPTETYGSMINEIVVIPEGITKDEDAIGIKEKIQKETYKSGNVPKWTGDR
ncbi:hypothetical protein ACQCVH_01900 [Bacillus infantis]|uniref:hypothetical protein n=1 Tax=Bacillus infantis TaxID=324767 RepID=UPI003CF47D5D